MFAYQKQANILVFDLICLGFKRMPVAVLEKGIALKGDFEGFFRVDPVDDLGRDSVRTWKKKLEESYSKKLSKEQRKAGVSVVLLPEKTILALKKSQKKKLKWLDNVGCYRDGHYKYFGVYLAEPGVFKKNRGGYRSTSGKLLNTGEGYWHKMPFRVTNGMTELGSKVKPRTESESYSEWIRSLVFLGIESIDDGPIWVNHATEYPHGSEVAVPSQIKTIRITDKQLQVIQQARETFYGAISNYKLLQNLFIAGCLYVADQAQKKKS